MTEGVNPRNTYLRVANILVDRIESQPELTEFWSHAEIMHSFSVSRGVVIRAVGVLKSQGLIEAVPGGRWRVVRDGRRGDSRPLAERIAEVITDDGLEVGAPFPSTTALCERFGVSRPTVRRALDKLEAQGLLSEGSQGKVRTVRALPGQEGTAKP